LHQKLLQSDEAVGVSDPLIQASLLGEAVEHGPVAVFVCDDNARYIAVNAAACAMLGYSREEILGLRVTDIATYAEAAEEFEELLDAGAKTGSATLTRKDGTAVRYTYFAGATRVAGMNVYVSVGAAT
jgi:PAS domain S-box-containing protein